MQRLAAGRAQAFVQSRADKGVGEAIAGPARTAVRRSAARRSAASRASTTLSSSNPPTACTTAASNSRPTTEAARRASGSCPRRGGRVAGPRRRGRPRERPARRGRGWWTQRPSRRSSSSPVSVRCRRTSTTKNGGCRPSRPTRLRASLPRPPRRAHGPLSASRNAATPGASKPVTARRSTPGPRRAGRRGGR